MLVSAGPHENNFCPAADALFQSAAVGVVLTGLLHNGAAGLEFIKRGIGSTNPVAARPLDGSSS